MTRAAILVAARVIFFVCEFYQFSDLSRSLVVTICLTPGCKGTVAMTLCRKCRCGPKQIPNNNVMCCWGEWLMWQ